MMKQLKYNRARLEIMRYIAERGITAGGAIPSTREFASILPYGEITLRHALVSMEEDGIVKRVPRSGTYLVHALKDNRFSENILYILVKKRGENISGFGMEHVREFLAEHGIGLKLISVYEFGLDLVEAAKDSIGILADGWLTDDFAARLMELKLPVVTLGNVDLRTPVPNVSLDLEAGAYNLTRQFIRDGRKKILLIESRKDYKPMLAYLRGYKRALNEAGLKPFVPEIAPLKESLLGIEGFLNANMDADAVITEPGSVHNLMSCLWRGNWKTLPAVGYLQLWGFWYYRTNKDYLFVRYPDSYRIATEMLYRHVSSASPLQNIVLPPDIPGIDSNVEYFKPDNFNF